MEPVLPKSQSRMPWAAAVGCALAGLVVFQFFGNATRGYIDTASVFWWWGVQWFDPAAETEHGVLILALSGWVMWRNLRIADCGSRIADLADPTATAPESNPRSGARARVFKSAFRNPQSAMATPLAAMAMGLAVHALGFAAQQTRVSIVAVLIFTWGVLRLAGGRRWGKAAVFPLGFLVFAIPLGALDTMGFWLRAWVIDASAALAHGAGIGVLQNGTQLVAPDGRYQYDVVAACSGVRSLTAMAALSLLMGYLNFSTWWRRAALLAACFPLVYLGNVARITSIVLAAQWGGQVWGERAHDVMGYGVFVIVLGGVMGVAAVVWRWWPERTGDRGQGTGDRGQETEGRRQGTDDRGQKAEDRGQTTGDRGPRAGRGLAVWGVTGVVVGLAVGEMVFLHALAGRASSGRVGVVLAADGINPVELPSFLGTEWIGRRTEVTAVEREILPADTGFARKNYVAVAHPAEQVFLSVVLSGRDRTSIHRPEICLVGQGWTITGAVRHDFKYGSPAPASEVKASGGSSGRVGGTRVFPATVLRIQREVTTPQGRRLVPQLTAYWFVGGDTVVATHWERLARDAWNRVVHARADRWAYVLMQTDATEGEAVALARMQAVLDEALPAFQRPVGGP